ALLMFFFFQAEDGIRDDLVTGVQTCALPICPSADAAVEGIRLADPAGPLAVIGAEPHPPYNRPPLSKGLWKGDPEGGIRRQAARSEERRVGKEWRWRWGREVEKKKREERRQG